MPEIKVIHEQERRCGYRKKGGLYLVGESGPGGVLPRWVSIEPPIPYEGDHFRGFVYVDGDQLLAREDKETWFIGPSLDRVLKENWTKALGMPLAVRCKFGICKGLRSVEEIAKALSHLIPPFQGEKGFSQTAKTLQSTLYKAGFGNTEADAAVTDLATGRLQRLTPAEILARCWTIARVSLWHEPTNGLQSPSGQAITADLMRLMTLINAVGDAVDLGVGTWRKAWKGK